MKAHITYGLGALFLLIAAVVWVTVIAPLLTETRYSPSFLENYTIFSIDNFFDESLGGFTGELSSQNNIVYQVIGTEEEVLIVENQFIIAVENEDPIIALDRQYGIDPKTGAHVPGFGDRDRTGYLFAPRNIARGESFIYWHPNYDAPAQMNFVLEEEVGGLLTYLYEADYQGVRIDQTQNLSHLPGVPEIRGVEVDPILLVWFDPITGSLIKYQDRTIAHYYDQGSGERTVPWNAFQNRTTDADVLKNVQAAEAKQFTRVLQDVIVPLLLLVGAVAFVLTAVVCRYQIFTSKRTTIIHRIFYALVLLVAFVALLVIVGWIFNIETFKSIARGLATMKFSTAFSFLLSAGIVLFAFLRITKNTPVSLLLLPPFGLFLMLIMGTLLSSAFLGVESGVERLIVEERAGAIQTNVSGRPSIGTMASFLLIVLVSVVALLETRFTRTALRIAGALLVGIGGTAFVGYIFELPILYYAASGVSTAMALHTSVLFVLLGTALFIISGKSNNQKKTL